MSTPDSASPQLNVTVTFELFQPLALAAGDALPLTVGGVLSTDTEVVLAVVELPTLSKPVPVTGCEAPSVETTWSPGQLATPDAASPQVKLTVTSVLFQPFELAAGDLGGAHRRREPCRRRR